MFAYLLDAQTISVIDLSTGLQRCTWAHHERVDWLELNETGNKLIYRDKALKLVLLDIVHQDFQVLLNFCGFVQVRWRVFYAIIGFDLCALVIHVLPFFQWVPQSDVVVAQSKDKLYVWYDFARPMIHPIGGGEANEGVEIERADGKTRVKMALPNTDIALDEVLLEFDTAIDDGDLER